MSGWYQLSGSAAESSTIMDVLHPTRGRPTGWTVVAEIPAPPGSKTVTITPYVVCAS